MNTSSFIDLADLLEDQLMHWLASIESGPWLLFLWERTELETCYGYLREHGIDFKGGLAGMIQARKNADAYISRTRGSAGKMSLLPTSLRQVAGS